MSDSSEFVKDSDSWMSLLARVSWLWLIHYACVTDGGLLDALLTSTLLNYVSFFTMSKSIDIYIQLMYFILQSLLPVICRLEAILLHIPLLIRKKQVYIHTSSTSFSRKGTSFRSSLSFLSTNQLSIGIPLESCKRHKIYALVSLWHRNIGRKMHVCNEWKKSVKKFYLIGKGLGWVVDYYRLGKIPSENV